MEIKEGRKEGRKKKIMKEELKKKDAMKRRVKPSLVHFASTGPQVSLLCLNWTKSQFVLPQLAHM
jgi:hypothetical protein